MSERSGPKGIGHQMLGFGGLRRGHDREHAAAKRARAVVAQPATLAAHRPAPGCCQRAQLQLTPAVVPVGRAVAGRCGAVGVGRGRTRVGVGVVRLHSAGRGVVASLNASGVVM
jgi:hypothetical protein